MGNFKEAVATAKSGSVSEANKGASLSPYQQVASWFKAGSETSKMFLNVCGKDYANKFMQSVLTIMRLPSQAMLSQCEPKTIVQSAMVAAYTGLSLEPSLGQSALIPYGKTCTFQIMKRGLIQLALRTGLVKTLNATKVYEGDIKSFNPFTGEYVYNTEPHERNILCGYMAYIQLVTGFEKYVYMSVEELKEHGQRYSKSYKTGLWTNNFDAMAEKTIIKRILRDSAIIDLSSTSCSKLAVALKSDGGTPSDFNLESEVEYPDAQTEDGALETKYEDVTEVVESGSNGELFPDETK